MHSVPALPKGKLHISTHGLLRLTYHNGKGSRSQDEHGACFEDYD